MDDKNQNDFFSSEKEYNMRNTANAYKDGDLGNVDYSKYLNDYDDGEDIVKKPSSKPDSSDKKEKPVSSKGKKESFIKKNNYKNLKIILICVIVAIVIAIGAGVIFIFNATKDAKYNDNGVDYNENIDIEEDENLNLTAMGDVTDSHSLKEYLVNWANNNGEKMHSKNVINVLLCGVDTEDGTASSGRADSIILVSVNKKAKTITLSSFFRDSYTYMEIPDKQGNIKERYEKINAAYNFGGPAALIDTIEKNFKVEIDQYVAVDFASFKNLIDALGGVKVDVQEYEAKFLRRTTRYKDFPSGKNCKLDGARALVYSRIRKLDSDVNRTERQRKVIKSLINSAKTATNGQLVNAYKQTAKYIRTGYSQTEVISLIAAAVAQDWMDFEMNEITLPSEQGIETVSAKLYTTSMPHTLQWVWIVDYPVCAQKLQLAIYGESNINLDADRTSALDFTNAKKESSSGSSSSSSSTDKTKEYKSDSPTKSNYSERPSSTSSYSYEQPTEYEPEPSTNPPEPTQATEENTEEALENNEE